jgi:hypothetical protein
MPNIINRVPAKRPEKETATVVDEHGERHPSAKEKMQRAANKAAHKAAKTEQNYDKDKSEFSNIGPQ